MFGVKIYVNVYRFLRKYSVFFICFLYSFISFGGFHIFYENKEKVQYPAPF